MVNLSSHTDLKWPSVKDFIELILMDEESSKML